MCICGFQSSSLTLILKWKMKKKIKMTARVCVCVATWNTRFFFYFVPKSLMFLHPSCQKLNEKKEEEKKIQMNLLTIYLTRSSWVEKKTNGQNQCWLLLSTILKTKQKKSNPSPCFEHFFFIIQFFPYFFFNKQIDKNKHLLNNHKKVMNFFFFVLATYD